jgi:hypothetical protein
VERKRALLGARIVFNNRSSVIDCTIRDLSEGGARLILGHPVPVPSEFELDIPSKAQRLHCELRWAAGVTCGVKFV